MPLSPTARFRSKSWKLIAATLTVPLIAGSVAALQSPAQALPSGRAAQPAATHTITLITGDVVTVTTLANGSQVADVDRPDSVIGGVHLREVGGDLYVLPDEVQPLLTANLLDRQLFNVTDLIEMGYDDAGTTAVPLIATYTGAKARAADPAAPRGSKVVRNLASIHGAALKAEKATARTFWNTVAPAGSSKFGAGVAKLWLDGKVQVNLAESVPMIGAPQAWSAGLDGTGVTVAVLDTGIDATHPDLAGQIDEKVSFVPGEDTSDVNGHGTHVASTIAGTGAASNGANKGVAPGADLVIGKVLNDSGEGQISWIVAGMEWAAASGADVINMSLGNSEPSDGTDPMSVAVDELSDQYGALFVIAAGNSGGEVIGGPGAAASALTIGAVSKTDDLAWFSSRGPMINGAIKPDLSAPGEHINAARSQQMADGETGLYRSISGTSMATPHVAGAAAILAQQHPDWSRQRLKDALMSSSAGLAEWYTPFEVGAGRLDVAAATTRRVQATGSVSFGSFDWPHEPSDAPVTKTVTLHNTGSVDVTLNLSIAGSGPFTIGTSAVTVPAGGSAEVTVTADPTVEEYGRFSAYLVGTDATNGAELTRTSLALIKEEERHPLTVKLIDRDGQPAASRVVVHKEGERWADLYDIDGEKTLRLPPGSYTIASYLDVPGEQPDSLGLALLTDPETVLDGPAEVVLDAREARLLDTAAPQVTEDRQRVLDFRRTYADGSKLRDGYAIPIFYDDLYVLPTEPATSGDFDVVTRWRKGEPMLRLTGAGFAFNATLQPNSAIVAGTSQSDVVYVGNGATEDYTGLDVTGKIALVERSAEVDVDARAAAAAAAGASMLLVVNDQPGVLNEYLFDGSPIPVGTVHRDLGQQLIAAVQAGKVTLTETRTPSVSYLYDLTRDYRGQVPDRALSYRPSQTELARINASYYNVTSPGEGSGYRYAMTFSPSVGFREREWHPSTRTEWVTPGQVWHETHTQGDAWEDRGYLNSYDAGTTTAVQWFKPIIRPAFGRGYDVRNSRWRDYLTLNVQPWSSSGGTIEHAGTLGWGTVPESMKLYAGDKLIERTRIGSDMQWVQVPSARTKFRLEHTASRPVQQWRLSTRTHTEWEFYSGTVNSDDFEPLDLLVLDYDIATDLHGDVATGGTQTIAVKAGPQPGGSGTGDVTSLTLDISYNDGASWQAVKLARSADGWWRGEVRLTGKSGAFVSVRGNAVTDAGWSIKQEVIRAYGLR